MTALALAVLGTGAVAQAVTERGFDVLDYRVDLSLGERLEVVDLRVEIELLRTRTDIPFELDLVNADPTGDAPVRVESVRWVDAPSGVAAGVDRDVSMLTFEHRDDKLRLQGIDAVGRWLLSVRLSGQPVDGLIRGDNRHGETVLFADHWPNRASHWLPSFDHPSSKARYRWTVTAPSRYQVVANGSLVEQADLEDGLRRTVWQSRQPLPAKVAVLGVARFSRLLLPGTDRPASYLWAYPQDAEVAFDKFDVAQEVVSVIERALGPQPYERIDHVQSTTRYGGMENAGAIFYSERAVAQPDAIDRLIAHEVAHQWFGDALTEASWRDTWLSEGFATFLTLWVTEQREGTAAAREARSRARRAVLRHAAERPAAVVRPPVEPPMDQILNAYTYQKGAWTLHMLRRRLGDEVFFDLVREFFERHRHGNATSEDFLGVVDRFVHDRLGPGASADVGAELSGWLFGAGHPQIEGSWNWRDGRLSGRLEQVQAWPPFTVPLVISWRVDGETVWQTVPLDGGRVTEFSWETAEPDDVVLDPEVDLLFEEVVWKRLPQP